VLACLLLVAGLSACGRFNGLESAGDKGFLTSAGVVTEVGARDRGAPVSFAGEDLEGNPLSLEDLRGKPVVVVVWGSWCTPCRAEAPAVVAAAKELGDRARFVGVNIRDGSQAQSQAFVRRFGVTYPSFWSPDGEALLAFPGVLGLRTIPAFAVLDAQGRVAGSIIGQLPSQRTLVDLTEGVDQNRSTHG
jgi:thiol-disulfide isomerase/thioredoxin